jgi:hypothetical protein
MGQNQSADSSSSTLEREEFQINQKMTSVKGIKKSSSVSNFESVSRKESTNSSSSEGCSQCSGGKGMTEK